MITKTYDLISAAAVKGITRSCWARHYVIATCNFTASFSTEIVYLGLAVEGANGNHMLVGCCNGCKCSRVVKHMNQVIMKTLVMMVWGPVLKLLFQCHWSLNKAVFKWATYSSSNNSHHSIFLLETKVLEYTFNAFNVVNCWESLWSEMGSKQI